MSHFRTKPAPMMALAGALIIPLLLVLGAGPGRGQEKAGAAAKPSQIGQQGTVESHDRTNFPLVGKHRTVACRECHINLVFEGTPTDCEACHWIRRQDDRYALRLGTRCSDCHTPQSWKKVDPALWSHEVNVGYKLEGIHRTLDCEACHGSKGFTAQSPDCFSCHEADYRGTQDPNHVQAGFPTTCPSCHTQRRWSDASFAHTGFVLQGRHATVACSDCHKNGVYQGTSTACVSCHLADYNGTTDPNHQASGFPTDCAECHGTSATSWSGADFSHTGFALQGLHSTAACTDCHKNGVYQGTSTACSSCHLATYNATTDPNHRSAGFPTDCSQCHGTAATGWSGAVFSHTGFTLQGLHKTAACADCHKNGVYQGTSTACVSCHL
ncbi:MAG TPA: cytochrome c3 family protein, partial [Acidobacteriota bacterium]|nr:cytochrome c3 family protein [Acidobacteriota bacterium]